MLTTFIINMLSYTLITTSGFIPIPCMGQEVVRRKTRSVNASLQ